MVSYRGLCALPIDVQAQVMLFVDTREVFPLRRVSSRFRDVCTKSLQLPRVVVTDGDGDGARELIVATCRKVVRFCAPLTDRQMIQVRQRNLDVARNDLCFSNPYSLANLNIWASLQVLVVSARVYTQSNWLQWSKALRKLEQLSTLQIQVVYMPSSGRFFAPLAFFTHLENLRKLSFTERKNVTSLKRPITDLCVLGNCNQLEEVRLRGPFQGDFDEFHAFSQAIEKLPLVKFELEAGRSLCYRIEDISTRFPHLEELVMGGVPRT